MQIKIPYLDLWSFFFSNPLNLTGLHLHCHFMAQLTLHRSCLVLPFAWVKVHNFQYNMPKDTTQWHQWGSNLWPLGLESSTLPLSLCPPSAEWLIANQSWQTSGTDLQSNFQFQAFLIAQNKPTTKAVLNQYKCKHNFNSDWQLP